MTYEDFTQRDDDICPDCDGTGYADGYTPYDHMKKHGLMNGSMSMEDMDDFEACPRCGGHGLVDEE